MAEAAGIDDDDADLEALDQLPPVQRGLAASAGLYNKSPKSSALSRAAIGMLPGAGIAQAAGYEPEYANDEDFIPSGVRRGQSLADKLRATKKNWPDIGMTALGALPDVGYGAAALKGINRGAKALDRATGIRSESMARGTVDAGDDLPKHHTETPEFKNWFGKSKVVDDGGKPMLVYKGMYPHDWTKEKPGDPGPEITSIKRPTKFPGWKEEDDEGLHIGGFFGNKETASRFAQATSKGAVYPVYVRIENPYVLDAKGALASTTQWGPIGKKWRDALRSGDHDGAIIKNTKDEGDLYVTLHGNQAKSRFNDGTWSRDDDHMSRAAGGSVEMAEPDANPFDETDPRGAPAAATQPQPTSDSESNPFDETDPAPGSPAALKLAASEAQPSKDYPAPITTVAGASLPPDPNDEIQWYADHFKQPVTDFKRVNNKILRKVPEKGIWAYVDPGTMRWIASGVGPAIPTTTGAAGATAAGLAAAPAGPIASTAAAIAGGTAAGSAGEVFRETLAKKFAGKDPNGPIDWGNVAAWGAAGAANEPGAMLFGALGRLALKIPGVKTVLEKAGIRTNAQLSAMARQAEQKATAENPLGFPPSIMQEIEHGIATDRAANEQAERDAHALGITSLSLGQKTQSPFIQATEDWLANTPEGVERMGRLSRQQNEQEVPGAVTQVLDRAAPRGTGNPIEKFRDASDAAVDFAKNERFEAATPDFQGSFKANQSMSSPLLDRILRTPVGKDALAYAVERMQNKMQRVAVPDKELTEQLNDLVALGRQADVKGGVATGLKLKTLDLVRQALWDVQKQLDKKVANGTARQGELNDVSELRKSFTKELKRLDVTGAAGPNSTKVGGGMYEKALRTYGEGSELLEQVLDGGIGQIQRMTGPDRLNMVDRIFRGSRNDLMADDVTQARQFFQKAGKIDDWNAALRSFLDGDLEAAMDTKATGRMGNVAGKMAGTFQPGLKREVLAAALGDPQKAAMLPRLYEVLKRASSMLPTGSRTAVRDELSEQSKKTVMTKVRGAFKMLSPHGAVDATMDRLEEHLANLNDSERRRQLLDFVLAPDSTQRLNVFLTNFPSQRAIQASPNVRGRAVAQLGRFLSTAGIYTGATEMPHQGEQ